MRRVLAASEVALAFVLVVVERTAASQLRVDDQRASGIPSGRRDHGFGRAADRALRHEGGAAFFTRALERMRALPGVREAAFGSDLPWTGYDENTSFSIIGRRFPDGEGPEARYHFITTGYTAATGTPLVAGRDLSASDVETRRSSCSLNESAARKYWKTPEAAVGARLNLWGKERTVVGVVGDVRDMPWHERAVPALYFPQAQEWYPQPHVPGSAVRRGSSPSRWWRRCVVRSATSIRSFRSQT